MAKKKVNTDPLWRTVFLLYSLALLWLLFDRSSRWDPEQGYHQLLISGSNFVPLYTIRNYLNIIFHYPQSSYYTHCIINLVGNIVLFVPVGVLFPRVFKKLRRFFPFLLICLLCLLSVETLQLLTLRGSFDVDDIILNLTGIVSGYLLYKLIFKK